MKTKKPQAICFVLTSPFVLNAFLLNHLQALAHHYAVTVCINTQESVVSPLLDDRVELIHLPIAREIDLRQDLIALVWLIRFFRHRKFDAVHSVTPKGGLLGMLAAKLTGVPHRIHTFTGQVWATRRGFSRWLLKSSDRLLALCSSMLLADSVSQAEFLNHQGICRKGSIKVLGGGSISGVDLQKFSHSPGRREAMRLGLAVPSDALVFVFVGRLHREKGVLVLARAFAELQKHSKHAWLWFVGPDEDGLGVELLKISGERSLVLGLTQKPEEYLDAADVLCLPSYREGFGTVVIEAAAMGMPAIGSDIYGLSDAIVNNQTGLLVPAGDEIGLLEAMQKMSSFDLRSALGRCAQQRAYDAFDAQKITASWLRFYATVFGSVSQEVPS